VFSSPLRTLETERLDKATGELKAVRRDPARHLYGEAGQDGVAWGSKYAVASTRCAMANQRVILAVAHVPHAGHGGEAGIFTDMISRLGNVAGIHAVVVDGALRGTHIAAIQGRTGIAVVSPPRRKTKQHGGTTIGTHAYAAHQLPGHRTRDRWTCPGHDLWAAGGTIHERTLLADGTTTWREVHRGQVKRERHQGMTGAVTWQLHAHYTLACQHTGAAHTWWERLTGTQTDRRAGFNRSDYLRALPGHHPGYRAVYRMRQDAESLNNTLERAFYGQRLPAWGTPNQTVIVLLACLAQNAWARHTHQVAQADLCQAHSPAA